MKHYLMVTEEHFAKAVAGGEKAAQKSGAASV